MEGPTAYSAGAANYTGSLSGPGGVCCFGIVRALVRIGDVLD